MKDFLASARPEIGKVNEDNAISFKHWDTQVTFYEPSEGQQAMMLAMGGRSMSRDMVGHFIHLFINLGDEPTQRYFRDLLLDRDSGFDVSSQDGIFDIWENLVEEWSGKDSESASGSASPRRATGARSTASTRVKASTSSRSRSRASST